MQDVSILLNLIIILLMLFNTYVFQVGLVSVLVSRFQPLLLSSGLYLSFSITLHCWLMVRTPHSLCFCFWFWFYRRETIFNLRCLCCFLQNLRWFNTNKYVWTDGLQVLFMLHRTASVLYYYFYKRTAECLGDPRLYEDSPWLQEIFSQVRQQGPAWQH
uniref:Transmembrane protein 138 n=1 Tax=Knipowitschia caucasica TaxID=637954 RepID=A0AAV2LV17_KNICA